MKVYTVDICEGESFWRFSTMELAIKCTQFFELDEDEYEIYQEEIKVDDEELLRRMKICKK